jgi:hypothetical protein
VVICTACKWYIDVASLTVASHAKFLVSIVAENQLDDLGSHDMKGLKTRLLKARAIVSAISFCYSVF